MTKRKPGRPKKVDPTKVAKWRRIHKATIAETARHFGISSRSVAKAWADNAEAYNIWKAEQETREDRMLDEAIAHLDFRISQLKAADARLEKAKAETGQWSEEALDAAADLHFWANSLIPDDDREKMWR